MQRELVGHYKISVKIISFLFAIFILYTAAFGVLPHMQQRSLVVFFGLSITLATNSAVKKASKENKIAWFDLIFIGLSALTCFNIAIRYKYYMTNFFSVNNNFEYILSFH